MSSNKKLFFRRANHVDMTAVREMIQELADFEKMSNGPELTEQDLITDSGLTGGKDYCHIYILDLQEDANKAPIPIGYAICFFAYSTWQGKTYFLEDLYVRPNYRNLGAGERMFREIAAQAKAYNCRRLDFHVLAWNPARIFYNKMGAMDLTETENWHFYRVFAPQIEKLANELNQ